MTKVTNNGQPVKPKKIGQAQVNGKIDKARVLEFLEQDINSCMQILYTIREDKELKEKMAEILLKRFEESGHKHV